MTRRSDRGVRAGSRSRSNARRRLGPGEQIDGAFLELRACSRLLVTAGRVWPVAFDAGKEFLPVEAAVRVGTSAGGSNAVTRKPGVDGLSRSVPTRSGAVRGAEETAGEVPRLHVAREVLEPHVRRHVGRPAGAVSRLPSRSRACSHRAGSGPSCKRACRRRDRRCRASSTARCSSDPRCSRAAAGVRRCACPGRWWRSA